MGAGVRRTILAASVALAVLVTASSAEAAIRLRPAKCPVPADASFRIVGARSELDGVASEYEWLRRERPGWKRQSQALIEKGGKFYDLLMIIKGRNKQVICFDITDFFGKHR